MAQPGEFDVEGAEDETGNVTAQAASSEDPPIPPEPEERKPEPAPEVRRIGRPPKARAPATPIQGTFGPPNITMNGGEDWPKDISGLWMSCLAWMKKENGGGPERFILWVWQARGATSPSRMPQPIHGEQVAGSEEVSAGEALLELVTDVFHIPSTNDAASYQVEICLRSTGTKVRKSEMFRLDRPEQIHRTRDAMRKRIAEASGGSYQPSLAPRYVAAAAYPQPHGYSPQPPAAAAAPPPVSGIDYVDRYIGQLLSDKQNAELREREREERQKETEEKHAREMAAIRAEMQDRFTVVTPPAAAVPAAPIESEDAKQAKLAATVAQSVMQTLIAAGVIGPKPAAAPAPVVAAVPPPTPEAMAQAVRTTGQNNDSLSALLDRIEEVDKIKLRMRKVLGVPDEAEDDDEPETPTNIHVEPAVTERRTQKYPGIYKGNDVHLAVYDPDDDAPTTMKRIVDFFQLNPTVTADVIQGVVGVAVTKLADGPLAALIPQLLNMPGAGAVAGSVLRGAVQGVAQAQAPSGGGTGSA